MNRLALCARMAQRLRCLADRLDHYGAPEATLPCPDCEGTGIAHGTWADFDAGKFHRNGRMLNMAICHCRLHPTPAGS